ncbi:MAG TPA: DUF5011 domain-containing protein [Epsilonproteobacteria bacterium]|nr:DUF5011 domain-containing protein [Campylobacterota bacterium]
MKNPISVVFSFVFMLLLSACVSPNQIENKDENQSNEDNTTAVCIQVITSAYNPQTNEQREFPTPCDVLEGWVVGKPPLETNSTNETNTTQSITAPEDVNETDTNETQETNNSVVCMQVITLAYDPQTNEERDFPTPCDVPEGWVVGTPPDTTPPEITLLGESNVTLNVGDVYVDAGATALDDKDGNLTTYIIIENNVDTSNAGSYVVTYNVSDAAQNMALEVNRTVVVNTSEVKVYGTLGKHKVTRYPDVGLQDDYVVYYPQDTITEDMPIVLFLEGGGSSPKIDDYRGVMHFMASQGYFVIGAESGESYDSGFAASICERALNVAKTSHNLSLKKLLVMGHSQGGGQAFYVMKHLQERGYGEDASLVLSIDGWIAFNMNEKDLNDLESDVAFVQMNGVDGTGTDPRIHLSIWNHSDKAKRYFFILPQNDHGYVAGDLENILQKEDLLLIVDAVADDLFSTSSQGYASIPQANKSTYADIYAALQTEDQYSADCAGAAYNASTQLNLYDMDYCSMRQFTSIATDQSVLKPLYLASYNEPYFGTTVTRITDREVQTGNAQPYPKTQAWNSDMTLIRLGYRLYDATNFVENPITQNQLIDGQLTEMKWSTKEPNLFYGINNRLSTHYRFTKATIGTNTITYTYPIAFSKEIYDEFLLGKYEGNIDLDEKYVVFAARKKEMNFLTAIVYDIENNTTIIKDLTHVKWYKEDVEGNFVVDSGENNQIFDWISVSPLGKSILINWQDEPENPNTEIRASIDQYDMQLNFIRKLADHGNHGDMGLDENGKEVYVQFGFGNDREGNNNRAIWSYPLDGTQRIELLPSKYGGGHVSCRNYRQNGWCYLSTSQEGFREALGVKLDGTGAVKRFAQTHFLNDGGNGDGANAIVSPDGTQMIFKSNWAENGGIWDSYHVKF